MRQKNKMPKEENRADHFLFKIKTTSNYDTDKEM